MCMYALASMYVGLALSTSSAYPSTNLVLRPFTSVMRVTVGHRKLGRKLRVSFNFAHALGTWGRQTRLNTSSFGAQTEMYSCVGSSLNSASLDGTVPLDTRNVVNPLLWN